VQLNLGLLDIDLTLQVEIPQRFELLTDNERRV
jgi:hypothetical protein